MAITEFNAALNQVASERGIAVDSVFESIKAALIVAYKKDYLNDVSEEDSANLDIKVNLDIDTGEAHILVDGVDKTPPGFGRIAAQTAKQVILQKIRETEKQVITDEYKQKVGTIINGLVFRVEHGLVILDLGKVHGIMPQSEQVQTETYRANQRLKVLIKDIRSTTKGTEVIVSRSDAKFVEKLFEQEVPEISSGVVKIKAIAREAGSRTKMAVSTSDDKIDPVGSCVGQKGVRVQAIISELYGEKIDIIPFHDLPEKFIAASLSPAKVAEVELDEENKKATVSVPEDQQSLAIGKDGQNARLANKLTKWKIDIKGAAGFFSTDISTTNELASDKNTSKKKVKGVWDDLVAEVNKQMEDEKSALDAAAEAEALASEKEVSLDASEDLATEEVVTEDTASN